jgi:hypothetical protein
MRASSLSQTLLQRTSGVGAREEALQEAVTSPLSSIKAKGGRDSRGQ